MSQFNGGRRISVNEMAPHVHVFLPYENKVDKISKWLINWINSSLKNGSIKPYDYLPLKGDLAFHIGVSLGTMQNVYRKVEDKGLIQSRQKVGSFIKDINDKNIEKLTSKDVKLIMVVFINSLNQKGIILSLPNKSNEVLIEVIKKYIVENKYKTGDVLTSARKLSTELMIPFATIRIALNSLISEKILSKHGNNYIIELTNFPLTNKEQQTLVEKIAKSIDTYIRTKLKPGSKLPSNNALADMFNVSIKTIHDAIKILSVAGRVKTRRGYYGTIVTDLKNDKEEFYFYEQVEESLKHYIAENYKIGDKLPTIKSFSEAFNVSTKTINNAFANLANEGYIHSVRGRYGGIFVLDIPPINAKGYTWLALSPEFEQMH